MVSDELKPCPFCGGQPTKCMDHSDVFIECASCNNRTSLADTWPEVIERWNRRAALSSAQAPEWQPIETAPDVGNVVVYGGRHAEPEIVCADGRWWRMEKLAGTPTHWMPLPAAPQPPAGKQ